MLFYALFGAQRVQSYTVHERPDPPTDRIDRADALKFIKDGFEFPAFLFAPFWLIGQRLWLGFAGYVGAAVLIALANGYLGLPDSAAVVLLIGLHLAVGFEGDAMARLDLESRGWTTLGSVTGLNRLDCERRFLDMWLPSQPILAGRGVGSAPPVPPAAPAAEPSRPPSSDHSVAGRLAALMRKPVQKN